MKEALSSDCEVIFLMEGDILSLNHCVEETKKQNKHIFIHLDLMKGLAKDKEGVKYLAHMVKLDGIVTTKKSLIPVIKKMGLISVLQLFVIDTQALESGIASIKSIQPDAVEMMPALMPRVIKDVTSRVDVPLILGGLIKTPAEAEEAIASGGVGLSVGCKKLWLNKLGWSNEHSL